MNLRNGKTVGINYVVGKCKCNRGYWASTVFRWRCSLCYREKYGKRLKSLLKLDDWLMTRDHEAQSKKVGDECLKRLSSYIRQNLVLQLLLELEIQKKNGRYLIFEQIINLYNGVLNINDYDQVHCLFHYVYDRWNVVVRNNIPAYSVCYYGDNNFWNRETFFKMYGTK